jgi:hypothetical protein
VNHQPLHVELRLRVGGVQVLPSHRVRTILRRVIVFIVVRCERRAVLSEAAASIQCIAGIVRLRNNTADVKRVKVVLASYLNFLMNFF